jgi:acetyl esterase/lipase
MRNPFDYDHWFCFRPPMRKQTTLWLALVIATSSLAAAPKTLDLWPGTAPGEKDPLGEERDMTKPADNLVGGKPVIRLGNVSKPTITILPPSKEKNTGAAVVILPGGGYHILAWDLEGTEVAEWLNSIGVTGIIVKYRVPKRAGVERHTAPLQDAQRAFGMVRAHAKEWAIDPQKIGVLGVSAGGHLAAALCNSTDKRTYEAIDDADKQSCRPDFMISIHPGYLTVKEEGEKIPPEVQVTTNTPPTFLVMTQDDPVRVENVIYYFLALKQARVPSELHVYPTGGHGYGLRRTEHFVTTWPDRATDWMRSQKLLGK